MNSFEAEIALVHGGGIEMNTGGIYQLQPGSVARAKRAAELFHDGTVENILFSGGDAHGSELPTGVSEAEYMANVAMANGVPGKKIECETASSSTIGNWANSAVMLQSMGMETVLGVTSKLAIPRARLIGGWMVHGFGAELDIRGYESSRESEGPAALATAIVRESAALPLATAWLANAQRKQRTIAELDEAYKSRRENSPVARVKASFTHR